VKLAAAPREGALEADAGGSSLADRIRARKAALKADRERVFALPGYEGVLEAEYRRLEPDELDKVLGPEIEDMNERYAQFLIDALIGLHLLDQEGARADRPLDWEAAARLAEPDAELSSARGAVLEVFDHNGHELRDHGDEVYRWMKGAHRAAEQAVAGG
jgi:hypothetical protein